MWRESTKYHILLRIQKATGAGDAEDMELYQQAVIK